MGVHMRLVGGIGDLLNGLIMLGFKDKVVVKHDLVAFDVILLVNMTMVVLGVIELSLGMTGA